MRLENSTTIFWMKLCTDKPFAGRYFYYLYKICSRVDTSTYQSIVLKLFLIVVVEFIAVAMAFCYFCFAVCLENKRPFFKCAVIGTQTHGASHIGDTFLLLHDVNDVMGGTRVHFGAVGIFVAQYITGIFNNHHLHTETDAEGGNVVCAGVPGSHDFAFNASLAESRADDNAVLALEHFCHVVVGELFGVDEGEHCLVVVVGASL